MLQRLNNRRGQSLLEQTILFLIVIAAILTIQTYVKRGLQGSLKSSTDNIGSQYTQSDAANYISWTNSTSNTTESQVAGVQATTLRADSVTNTLTNIQLNAFGEYWGNP